MLDPRRLLTFREVAHRGSFSRAAEALALTQPAVSQQIGALERQLGARLLERGPGGLTLTEAGELLLQHADVVADRLGLAEGQLGELTASRALHVRVGAFPSAMATIVPAALARLTEEEPAVGFDAVEGTTEELVAGVRSGDLHASVTFQDAAQPRREHPGTARLEVLEEPFVALLPPEHPLAGDRTIRLADLAEEVWLAPSRSGLIDRACRAAGFEPNMRYISRDPLANRAIVAAGLAVTMSPAMLAETLHDVAIVGLRDAPRRSVYALLPDAGAAPLARAFVAALRAEGERSSAAERVGTVR